MDLSINIRDLKKRLPSLCGFEKSIQNKHVDEWGF